MAAKAAPSALVVATRAADGGCSGHGSAPQRPTGTEDGQDREGSARRTTRLRSGRCSPAGGWCPALSDGRPGRTMERHQPPGGQHRCLRCCRRNEYNSAPRSRSSTQCRLVPLLHDVAPQMVEQLGGLSLTSRLPCSRAGYRRAQDRFVHPALLALSLGVSQTVEQLVEAPTIVSLIDVIRQPVEQPVDIPVRAWSGTGGRLQGFLPGQYSSSSVEQIADIPVPHHGIFCRFSRFFTQDRVQQRVRSSSLTFEFLMVARISKILVSHRFLMKLLGKRFKGFSALFPGGKKSAKIGPHSGSELLPESGPSTRAAHSDQFREDESGGTWMLLPSGRWYLLCSDPEVFWDGPG